MKNRFELDGLKVIDNENELMLEFLPECLEFEGAEELILDTMNYMAQKEVPKLKEKVALMVVLNQEPSGKNEKNFFETTDLSEALVELIDDNFDSSTFDFNDIENLLEMNYSGDWHLYSFIFENGNVKFDIEVAYAPSWGDIEAKEVMFTSRRIESILREEAQREKEINEKLEKRERLLKEMKEPIEKIKENKDLTNLIKEALDGDSLSIRVLNELLD